MAKMLNFRVQVSAPELIRPEKPTPRDFLYLSNIDDQSGLRNHIPFVHFYPPSKAKQGQDPVVLIKQALSKVLVYYFPVAGRLRNSDNGKLVVECNGEGVIFREANAGVELAELREVDDGLRPPFPQWDKLLVDDIWGSNFITDSPLLRMQVTRLACGGFVLAYTFNHCICDAYGAYLFMQAISEFCRNPNRTSPSSLPSWGREILKPRSPPTISYPHTEYDSSHSPTIIFTETQFKHLAQTSVFFSCTDISLLKNQIPGQKVPTFDAVASCLWRARTRTLLSPESTTRLLFPIDTRFRYKPLLPKGYYGSAVVFPCAITEAAKLDEKPLPYAASLISTVKQQVTGDEYRASVLDFIEINGRRGFCAEGAFVVSDMTRLRFTDIDFGWDQALYGGPARAGTGVVPGMVTSIITHKSEEGIEGVLALVSLLPESVERFHKEIKKEIGCVAPSKLISSAL
ncbi:Transferase [Parasponia andersonii]|uniref:Transferase n=1 Tax=Parasponia andersonii TaxID=3476 RepID=A0A2P5DVY5_PARAD|nr:Transferase [Parasponia andersonii]